MFELAADLRPDYEHGKLVVRLHGMANPRSNRALESLCKPLNDLNVRYPGTTLRLVLETSASRQFSAHVRGSGMERSERKGIGIQTVVREPA